MLSPFSRLAQHHDAQQPTTEVLVDDYDYPYIYPPQYPYPAAPNYGIPIASNSTEQSAGQNGSDQEQQQYMAYPGYYPPVYPPEYLYPFDSSVVPPALQARYAQYLQAIQQQPSMAANQIQNSSSAASQRQDPAAPTASQVSDPDSDMQLAVEASLAAYKEEVKRRRGAAGLQFFKRLVACGEWGAVRASLGRTFSCEGIKKPFAGQGVVHKRPLEDLGLADSDITLPHEGESLLEASLEGSDAVSDERQRLLRPAEASSEAASASSTSLSGSDRMHDTLSEPSSEDSHPASTSSGKTQPPPQTLREPSRDLTQIASTPSGEPSRTARALMMSETLCGPAWSTSSASSMEGAGSVKVHQMAQHVDQSVVPHENVGQTSEPLVSHAGSPPRELCQVHNTEPSRPQKPQLTELPAEPTEASPEVASLVVKLPDGSRRSRRFRRDQKVQTVYDWLETVLPEDQDQDRRYILVNSFPRRRYADKDTSLEAVGIAPGGNTLYLELL